MKVVELNIGSTPALNFLRPFDLQATRGRARSSLLTLGFPEDYFKKVLLISIWEWN